MKRRVLGIVAATAVTAAFAAALMTLGGFSFAAEDLNVIHDPPPGGGCICPANYDPVKCRKADGSTATFSNACVAGCHGYFKCARIVDSPPTLE